MAEMLPDGGVTTYRPDGSVLAEATYAGGILHGPYRDFWSNGRVSLEGQYLDVQQDGEWRSYDQGTGEVREVLRFVGGREVGDAFLGRSGPEGGVVRQAEPVAAADGGA